MMLNFAGTPRLDYEAWRALARSEYGVAPEVSEPAAFSGWTRTLSVYGFWVCAAKIQGGFGAPDLDCNAHRVEWTHRDVRRVGNEDYYALFQVGGRTAFIQNDQAVELAGGDVALVDASRPSIYCTNANAQRLLLCLPRQSLVSHLGFEPQGGLYGRGGTRAPRLLYQLLRDAIEDAASLSEPASAYMQLAVYDLLGAVFAQSDAFAIHNGKLFARICGIIKDRFADPDLGPYEVATEAGISLRYLQKLFTARGSTCIHYIHSLRLDHAVRLLQRRASLGTRQPLSEIAYACGFRDYSYFVRKFHHRFGCPPGAHGQGG